MLLPRRMDLAELLFQRTSTLKAVQVKHEGTASGEMGKIGDAETYFAYPEDKSTSKAVLMFASQLSSQIRRHC